MPPQIRSGTFEIGDLVVTPPPPIESTAPESLVGSFAKADRLRFELLTEDRGRCFTPGAADYFTYDYRILDETSAEAVLTAETGDRVTRPVLTFDDEGEEGAYTSVVTENGIEAAGNGGEFELGENRKLTDLKIGTEAEALLGDDLYGSGGHRQTVKRLLTQSGAVIHDFAVQNDGNTDAFRLRARTAGAPSTSPSSPTRNGKTLPPPSPPGDTKRVPSVMVRPGRSRSRSRRTDPPEPSSPASRRGPSPCGMRGTRSIPSTFSRRKKPAPPRGRHGRR